MRKKGTMMAMVDDEKGDEKGDDEGDEEGEDAEDQGESGSEEKEGDEEEAEEEGDEEDEGDEGEEAAEGDADDAPRFARSACPAPNVIVTPTAESGSDEREPARVSSMSSADSSEARAKEMVLLRSTPSMSSIA